MDMMFTSVMLGLVEGLTEFLPVSSTGHLIIASELFGFTGERADVFNVVIQAGAMLAVLVLYWKKFFALLAPRGSSSLSGMHGIFLLVLTTLPGALLGLLLRNHIKVLFSPGCVAAALVCGALFMLLAERYMKKSGRGEGGCSPDQISAWQAAGIGCFQCLALWPGFSRSASTIIGGMLLGVSRRGAAEYSFLAAVPIILGAAGCDLIQSFHLFRPEDIPFFLCGSAAAFLSAVLAMKTFICLLGRVSLRPFAWYRIILAVPVYWFMAS